MSFFPTDLSDLTTMTPEEIDALLNLVNAMTDVRHALDKIDDFTRDSDDEFWKEFIEVHEDLELLYEEERHKQYV